MQSKRTSGSTDLDVQGVDSQLLAANSNVLGSQHSSVGRGLVTVSLDLHTTGDTADGFATTGITQNISPLSYMNILIVPCFLPDNATGFVLLSPRKKGFRIGEDIN